MRYIVVLLTTGSGIVPAKIITVCKLTAIGEAVENIDVLCHDLPFGSTIDGVLGLNFLKHFDVNISFSTGIIELQPATSYTDWYDAQRRPVRNAHGPLGDLEDEPDWSLLK